MAEKRPDVVEAARKIAAQKPRKSLLKVAAALEEAGHGAAKGRRFSVSQVSRMLVQ